MTIQAYFDTTYDIFSDEHSEAMTDLYQRFCDDDDFDIDAWAAEHGVDLTISRMVMGEMIPEFTLWCWDMEEVF